MIFATKFPADIGSTWISLFIVLCKWRRKVKSRETGTRQNLMLADAMHLNIICYESSSKSVFPSFLLHLDSFTLSLTF